MFIPYRTDAPVYHWPACTVGLIVVNIAVFIAMASGAIDFGALIGLVLRLGDGLHPLQWLTSSFVHGDIYHLIGNMVFLWVFGLVIEGKVGLWFLPIYLSLGVTESALEQICFLGLKEGVAFGASGILFGLLTMAMIWAPENEVEVVYWIRIRPGTLSVKIRTLCLVYLLLDIVLAAFDHLLGLPVRSSLFHLTGAVLGFILGILLLKAGLVDCEGWDLFSLRKKRKLPRRRTAPVTEAREEPGGLLDEPRNGEPVPGVPEEQVQTPGEKRADALFLIRDHLQSKDVIAAKLVYEETVRETGPWPLPGPDLLAMVNALQKSRLWLDSLPFLQDYLERFPEKSSSVRLLLGKVLIENARRPASGIDILESIRPGELAAPQEEARQKLIQKAYQLRDGGVLELDVE